MKGKLQEFWNVPKNRVLLLILAALVALLLLDPFSDDAPAATVPAPSSAPASSQTDTEKKSKAREGAIAVEVNKNPTIKDPFKIPVEYQEPQKEAPGAPQAVSLPRNNMPVDTAKQTKPQKESDKPIAKGIISDGSQYIAILEYGQKSYQCVRGEYVGSYQVVSVYSEWVTLVGPEGTIALKVGR